MSLGGFGPCGQPSRKRSTTRSRKARSSSWRPATGASTSRHFAPANCGGVITVGAHGNAGRARHRTRTSAAASTCSAPGGDGDDETSLIVSTYAYGSTTPGRPGVRDRRGHELLRAARERHRLADARAGSHAHRGTCASILGDHARVPARHGVSRRERLRRRPSRCRSRGASTPRATAAAHATPVVEYYRSDLDHYFVTADPAEVAFIEKFLRGIYQRTGLSSSRT